MLLSFDGFPPSLRDSFAMPPATFFLVPLRMMQLVWVQGRARRGHQEHRQSVSIVLCRISLLFPSMLTAIRSATYWILEYVLSLFQRLLYFSPRRLPIPLEHVQITGGISGKPGIEMHKCTPQRTPSAAVLSLDLAFL
jgi:hypothetical protein